MDNSKLLIRKYLDGTCTEQELSAVLMLMKDGGFTADWEAAWDEDISHIDDIDFQGGPDVHDRERIFECIYKRLHGRAVQQTNKKEGLQRKLWYSIAAAVIVLVALAIGWLLTPTSEKEPTRLGQHIAPGGNRATLTLADGLTIDLSEEQAGIIVGDGITYLDGSKVLEQGQGSLFGTENGNRNTQYAILSTPKGGTYQVTLPDGSRVWINAVSTLRYPSDFDGDERVVELEGEGYFDVRHEANTRPFRVVSKGQVVEVLGTEFNISAYPDEAEVKTTLVEGSVKVALAGEAKRSRGDTKVLKPGQQALTRGAHIATQDVDTAPYVAWKSGKFTLDNLPITDIMRMLSRWYDVDVRYQGTPPTDHFWGSVSRFDQISSVLQLLELTDQVHFEVKGRTVFVINNKQ